MELSVFINQSIGALGYFLLANSYFNKKKSRLLIVQLFANILLAIHFYYLAGLAGAVCDIVCIFVDIIIYLYDKHKGKHKVILAILLILSLFIVYLFTLKMTGGLFTFEELFPLFATCIIVVSLVSSNKNLIRLIGLIAAICWLVYGIIHTSYASMVFELIIIISTIASYFRENHLNKAK